MTHDQEGARAAIDAAIAANPQLLAFVPPSVVPFVVEHAEALREVAAAYAERRDHEAGRRVAELVLEARKVWPGVFSLERLRFVLEHSNRMRSLLLDGIAALARVDPNVQ